MYRNTFRRLVCRHKEQPTLCVCTARAKERKINTRTKHKTQAQTHTCGYMYCIAVENSTFEKLNVESDSITKGVKGLQANSTTLYVCVCAGCQVCVNEFIYTQRRFLLSVSHCVSFSVEKRESKFGKRSH